MNPTLDQALCTKYPKILSSLRYGSIECGDGWYDLIDTLCLLIQSYIDTHDQMPQVVALQVKEKFGGLRFYCDGGNEYINGMIRLAEELSYHICDECGNKGESNTDGWIATRCPNHHKV